MAKENYPLTKQKGLLKSQSENNIVKIHNQTNLPQITLNGQATYQSEVTQFPIKIPNVEVTPLSKDQYKLFAEISQNIFDGGQSKELKNIERLNYEVENQKLEVELYKLKERVNQLYFNSLFLYENAQLLALLKEDLLAQKTNLEKLYKNGTATASNIDKLEVEVLKIDQQMDEINISQKSIRQMLSILTGQEINENVVFEKPGTPAMQGNRPETELFKRQKLFIENQNQINESKLKPRVNLFLQTGFGRPALNFLNNSFRGYYLGGVRFTWNIGNFYNKTRDRQSITISQQIVDIQEEVFNKNLSIQQEQQLAEIARYEKMKETDREIILKREKIKNTASVQLKNGIINFTDYFNEANALNKAQLNEKQHELQLLFAKINYQTILGE